MAIENAGLLAIRFQERATPQQVYVNRDGRLLPEEVIDPLLEDMAALATLVAELARSASAKTLRDEFAMVALPMAFAARAEMPSDGLREWNKIEAVAQLSYEIADAMMEARKASRGTNTD